MGSITTATGTTVGSETTAMLTTGVCRVTAQAAHGFVALAW